MQTLIVALPLGIFALACSKSDDDDDEYSTKPNGDNPSAPPRANGTQIVYSANTVGSHFHTFSLDSVSLTAPPQGGIGGSTASADNHDHALTITAADLQRVNAGETVKVTTLATENHTHVFTLVKLG